VKLTRGQGGGEDIFMCKIPAEKKLRSWERSLEDNIKKNI